MRKVVATGTWLYDGVAPRRVQITAKPVELAGSRYDDDEQLDLTTPVPETPDGFLYEVGATGGGEFSTLVEAREWANAQPWGPVSWDD